MDEEEELNYRYDTQLLIEGKGLDEDKIRDFLYLNGPLAIAIRTISWQTLAEARSTASPSSL